MGNCLFLRRGAPPIDVASLAISYTGAMTDELVTMDNDNYRLLTLTTDGTLTIEKKINADVWICGGGSNGLTPSKSNTINSGGAGAYCASALAQRISSIVAVIGPANTESGTVLSGDVSLNASGVENSPNGGTGGGGGGNCSGGTGDGLSKVPFDSSYFQPHCAGGGGSVLIARSDSNFRYKHGGDGGSNGSNGTDGSFSDQNATYGNSHPNSLGGTYGGGNGVNNMNNGKAAFGYGSGGSGGACNLKSEKFGAGGAGYQGVCYIRIPIDQ